jgi:hypothetical protein
MALIGDNMAVIGNEIRDNAIPNQALHERDVMMPVGFLTIDHADLVRRDSQKRLEPRDPLLKLPPMDENQGVPSSARSYLPQQRSFRMPWSPRAHRFRV